MAFRQFFATMTADTNTIK